MFKIEDFDWPSGLPIPQHKAVLTWCPINGYQFMYCYEVDTQYIVAVRGVVV